MKELEFVTEEARARHLRGEAELPQRSGRASASRCRRRRRRSRRWTPATVARCAGEGGAIGISVDGPDHTLDPEDMASAMEPLDGYQVEAEAGRAVALALELDDELRREGLAREIVHAVQNARKEAGLEITDRIELALGGDEELLDAARAHEDYVGGETLATSVAYDGRRRRAGDDRRPRAADRGRALELRPAGDREVSPSVSKRISRDADFLPILGDTAIVRRARLLVCRAPLEPSTSDDLRRVDRLDTSARLRAARAYAVDPWTNRHYRGLGQSRLELGLEPPLRHRADDPLRRLAALEEDHRRDREHLVLSRRSAGCRRC